VYQEGVKHLQTEKPYIIHELSTKPRDMSAIKVVDYLMNSYIDQSVYTWEKILNAVDIPSLGRTMSATFSMILALVMPQDTYSPFITQIAILKLMDYFKFKIDDEANNFIAKEYLPNIQIATSKMREALPQEEINTLLKNTVGTVIKFVYAFLWQEEAIKINFLKMKFINTIGAKLLPMVNDLATTLTNFEHNDPNFQKGENFYPGEHECNEWDPHAKWHLQTAIALPDFAFLFDELHRLINTES
jgi:hypothetical protein